MILMMKMKCLKIMIKLFKKINIYIIYIMSDSLLCFPNDLSKNNFPNRTNLINLLNNIKFNNLLNSIKDKILLANNTNLNHIKLPQTELNTYSNDIINDLKQYLINNNYIIIQIEDNNGVNQGLKIQW